MLLVPLAAQSQERAEVAVTRVTQQAVIEEISSSGSLISLRNAEVSVKTAGAVQTTAVDAGDRVRAEQLLLQLDDKLIQRELALAQAREQQAGVLADDARQQLDELIALAEEDNVAASEVRRARASFAGGHVSPSSPTIISSKRPLTASLRSAMSLPVSG
ncbi:hypothetical protein IDSA_03850 [Pseudidiomarina salinarum]|uniref:Membrane fusion protein biotin-lipoyl like domain-containing protein n=1 Tax=Pseudidiomarina salinarum TaxID=435908 RepID=A0A094IXI4_9GAMM|nr:hypothetical protein IDSA_03850 [Pseudidiomarina salinarum]RUO70400.1 hypothetical protein CWI79_02735 [Pseudidiomarina salinarum]